MLFRPAPIRRIRPGIAFPAAISRIPLAIAFRESPHARRTPETPPYPNERASLAAISRRLLSSRSGHTSDNFRRSNSSSVFMQIRVYIYPHSSCYLYLLTRPYRPLCGRNWLKKMACHGPDIPFRSLGQFYTDFSRYSCLSQVLHRQAKRSQVILLL